MHATTNINQQNQKVEAATPCLLMTTQQRDKWLESIIQQAVDESMEKFKPQIERLEKACDKLLELIQQQHTNAIICTDLTPSDEKGSNDTYTPPPLSIPTTPTTTRKAKDNKTINKQSPTRYCYTTDQAATTVTPHAPAPGKSSAQNKTQTSTQPENNNETCFALLADEADQPPSKTNTNVDSKPPPEPPPAEPVDGNMKNLYGIEQTMPLHTILEPDTDTLSNWHDAPLPMAKQAQQPEKEQRKIRTYDIRNFTQHNTPRIHHTNSIASTTANTNDPT